VIVGLKDLRKVKIRRHRRQKALYGVYDQRIIRIDSRQHCVIGNCKAEMRRVRHCGSSNLRRYPLSVLLNFTFKARILQPSRVE